MICKRGKNMYLTSLIYYLNYNYISTFVVNLTYSRKKTGLNYLFCNNK